MEFVPGIQFQFNIRRAIIVTPNIKKRKEKNHIVISKDGGKNIGKIKQQSVIKNT